MSIYKMSGTNANGDALSLTTIQNPGVLNTILICGAPAGMDALDDRWQLEIAFRSTRSFGIDDIRGSIAMLQLAQEFLTSGGGIGSTNLTVPGLEIPVDLGERIYVHGTVSTGVAGVYEVFLYVNVSVDARGKRRRR